MATISDTRLLPSAEQQPADTIKPPPLAYTQSLSPAIIPASNNLTTTITTTTTKPLLPPLPYSLHEHKRGLAIASLSIFFGAWFAPIALYFVLTRLSSLSAPIIFTIITTVPILHLLTYIVRTWKLVRASAASRPINGSPRWALDYFHWNYSVGVVAISSLLSVGSALGDIRLLSLPLPYLLVAVGAQTVAGQAVVGLFPGWRAPVRVSSCRRGEVLRAPVFVIVEDVVAVDGGGAREFREAWGERYLASAGMRRLLGQMGWFWGVPGLALGVVLIVLVGTVQGEVAYVLAWTAPWVWVAVWTCITIRWVRKSLEEERREFENLTV